MNAMIDGQIVKIGDWVGFKSDIEQSGRIYKIDGHRLFLENPNGFEGDYIGGQDTTVQNTKDCWID